MGLTRTLLLATALLASAQAAGLIDNPIVGDSVKYLDGDVETREARTEIIEINESSNV